MTPTISVTQLSRRYRDQAALDNVSLAVEPGTVTGLLGRNGAGKTTLLRIITGLEFPSTGEVKVFGALAVVAVVTLTHHWTAFGHFFTTVQAPALTGVLAALTLALGLGGFTTMRRVTV